MKHVKESIMSVMSKIANQDIENREKCQKFRGGNGNG